MVTLNVSLSPTECIDKPDYLDSTCAEYALPNNAAWCGEFGSTGDPGQTPNENCCACKLLGRTNKLALDIGSVGGYNQTHIFSLGNGVWVEAITLKEDYANHHFLFPLFLFPKSIHMCVWTICIYKSKLLIALSSSNTKVSIVLYLFYLTYIIFSLVYA